MFQSIQRGIHVIPGRPAFRVSMIHVADLANGLIAVARHGEGVYYIAHQQSPAWDTLGDLIATAMGTTPPRRFYLPAPITWTAAALTELSGRLRDRPVRLSLDKHRESRAGDWCCDPGRLAALGWRAEPLKDRLAQTVQWYRQAGWLSP